MTPVEQKIDQEVGLETEQERVTYLKFVAMGRELEGETRTAQGQFSKADVSAALEEVFSVLAETGKAQGEVEKVDEDEALAAIKAKLPETAGAAYQACEDLINNVDAKHTALIHERDAKLKAIKEKWL
jgi:hypothetical protein